MNGAARSGHASPEKNAIVIRAMSASATGSSPVSSDDVDARGDGADPVAVHVPERVGAEQRAGG